MSRKITRCDDTGVKARCLTASCASDQGNGRRVSVAWLHGLRRAERMKKTLSLLALSANLWFIACPSWAQTSIALGRADFRDNCASCHGMTGKGDGPMRSSLVKPPADLTMIAQRNGGEFPREQIGEVIDGRVLGDAGPHGSREMPVWGQVFKRRAMTQPGDSARTAEWSAQDRIISLLKYLEDIQGK